MTPVSPSGHARHAPCLRCECPACTDGLVCPHAGFITYPRRHHAVPYYRR